MTDEQTSLIGREFRHFKGNLYRLEGFAKDSETLEEMVVYRALYGEGGLWVRPAKMFFETIEREITAPCGGGDPSGSRNAERTERSEEVPREPRKTMKRFELVEDA